MDGGGLIETVPLTLILLSNPNRINRIRVLQIHPQPLQFHQEQRVITSLLWKMSLLDYLTTEEAPLGHQ